MSAHQVFSSSAFGRNSDRKLVTDEALIGEFATGNAAAYEVLFNRYYKPIHNFISKQISESVYVEDIAQEVFLRVFKSACSFDVTRKFSSWIYKIALNEIKRYWKRSHNRHTFSLNVQVGDEAGDSERGDFLIDHRLAPDLATEQQLVSRDLKAMIDRLPEKQKVVVLLKVYHELTFEEIANICDCPLSTVLSRMRYAVSKIKHWLAAEHHPAQARAARAHGAATYRYQAKKAAPVPHPWYTLSSN